MRLNAAVVDVEPAEEENLSFLENRDHWQTPAHVNEQWESGAGNIDDWGPNLTALHPCCVFWPARVKIEQEDSFLAREG